MIVRLKAAATDSETCTTNRKKLLPETGLTRAAVSPYIVTIPTAPGCFSTYMLCVNGNGTHLPLVCKLHNRVQVLKNLHFRCKNHNFVVGYLELRSAYCIEPRCGQ